MNKTCNLVVLSILLSGICNDLRSQQQKTWQWVSQLGGKSWDITSGVTCDAKNNLYIAGSFFDTLYCLNEKVISAGNQDVFVARFDEKGNIKDLWSGGGKGDDQATCITHSLDNSIIIGGLISGSITFGNFSDVASGNRLFLANLSNNGKITWLTTLFPSGEASLFLIGTDDKGRIYASGIFSGSLTAGNTTVTSSGKKDIFVVRLNPGGTVEKIMSLGGEEDDLPTAFTVSDSGTVVIAGTIGKAFAVDDLELSSATGKAKSNAFIIEFNQELKAFWKTQITGDEYGQVASLRKDLRGNLYAAGSFNARLWPGDTVLTSLGYTDGFLLKYGSNGKLLWGRSYGTWYYDYGGHVIPDNLGGTVITGSIGDTLVIDSLTVNPKSSSNSALAIQFSPEGKATWADCISGSGRNFSDGAVLDHKGNLYLSGSFRDKFEKESDALLSHGDQDIFLAKYFNCPIQKAGIIGDKLLCPGSSSAELSVKPGYSHVVWNDTLANQNYMRVEKPGKYWVSLMDKRGCILTDTLDITLADPSLFSLGDDVSLPFESTLLIKAPGNFSDFQWQDHSQNPTFLARVVDGKPGTYTYWLSAIDSLGCPATDTLLVEFYNAPSWIDLKDIHLVTYPNPVDNWLTWSLDTEQPCRLYVELTDDNGKLITSQYVGEYLPGTEMKINFSDIPHGVYYFSVKDGSGQSSKSVSIVRQ
jgi:hypothetical protein